MYLYLMLNYKIIYEFQKLANFIQLEIDQYKKEKNNKLVTANSFRLKSIKNILIILKNYTKDINNITIKELAQLKGISKGTLDRINEILNNGKLLELENFDDPQEENNKLIEELESIVGVGRINALKFINQGVTSVNDLKDKIESGELKVNDKILLGIKYYGKFFGDIPRQEITKIKKLIEKEINIINKKYKLNDDNKYIFEICGSYRREKETSGDVDVLFSKYGTKMNNINQINHLDILIQKLKQPTKINNNNPLLIDDITDKNYETKYMGFIKYKNNPCRRIDIRYVSYDVFPSALLYFTGSPSLNLQMRKVAKAMGYKLSEYGLTNLKDKSIVEINSEYDVFKFLQIEYLPPKLR
jgi:DNA polymerase/3'-5' exonuclease PolX